MNKVEVCRLMFKYMMQRFGSRQIAMQHYQVRRSYFNQILSGTCPPREDMLDDMGLERVPTILYLPKNR